MAHLREISVLAPLEQGYPGYGEKVILSMVQLKLKEYLPVTRFEKKASLPET